MNYRKDKMERLSKVAHMYYEEDRTQGEIAAIMHVSRPLVSRMLREARDLGIVEIRVHKPSADTSTVLSRLCGQYGLQGGGLIAEEESKSLMDYNLAKMMLKHIETEQPETLGVGWGTTVGMLTSLLERMLPQRTSVRSVCPLIGNSSVSSRHYHTDENVRIIASGLCAQPKFLYTPAFAEDEAERSLLCATSHYRNISAQWDQMDMAIVGIYEFVAERDANSLQIYDNVAAGRMIGYGFDGNGRMIQPQIDRAIHISLEQLAHCRQVIGLCAADVSPRTLSGALRTGLLTHVFVRELLADAVIANEQSYA